MDAPAPAAVVLSGQVGLPVLSRTGQRLGRLTDLVVRLGPSRPPVDRVLVSAGRSAGLLVPWSDVAELAPDRVVLRAGAEPARVDPTRPPLEPRELLVARDVLDTQVVDLRGHRLSRVSEVLLLRTADGLELAAADLGTAALLRRVGLGRLVRARPALAVDWADLHLTSPRGHQVQLSTSAASFRRLDARGLAELLTRLSTSKATDVLGAVDPAHAAAAIHHSHPRTGRRLFEALSPGQRRRLRSAADTGSARTIAELGRHEAPGRRFLRTSGWRLHRPPGRPPER